MNSTTTSAGSKIIRPEKGDDDDDNPHIACGYLAGLHSHCGGGDSDNDNEMTATATAAAEFSSFESAWDTIRLVPNEMLNEFEDELWTTQKKKFVYGMKTVSVIDAIIQNPSQPSSTAATEEDDEEERDVTVFRYLISNERPNLIQTAVEVSYVGASYNYCDHGASHPRPSPLSQTHLGGLAMALPFWCNFNNGVVVKDPTNDDSYSHHPHSRSSSYSQQQQQHQQQPNCVLIGLAHTLAVNLNNNNNDQRNTQTSSANNNINNNNN
eukprot:CAMPEP_0170820040 /NCGR_PEP_ID=MMETSP0733-20121128/42015_1 /TAXON_ID=186038 /ORGANISM="Fragilariopsis kerguelensis, Strain L26-C5" /LENGTH=266 /DNA_ID=CAMNT_0011181109 /DNA_START=348 /DNA_END=1145 /DNA_ORIENTATION=+